MEYKYQACRLDNGETVRGVEVLRPCVGDKIYLHTEQIERPLTREKIEKGIPISYASILALDENGKPIMPDCEEDLLKWRNKLITPTLNI